MTVYTHSIIPKFYHFCLKFVQRITFFLVFLLFTGSFLFTCYAENMETQQVLTRLDHPLGSLFGILLFLGILGSVLFLIRHNVSKWKNIILFCTLGWIIFAGVLLILFSKTVPAADAMSVYSAAEALALGDTSVIHPTDSYLSYYPQQVGLVAFLELLIRIWNLFGIDMPAYHFIKGIYVLLLCIAVWYQYKSVHLLFQDAFTDSLYLLLAGSNLPMIMYTSFVYGEIPSFTAFSIGLYLLLKLQSVLVTERTHKILPVTGSLFFLGLSVMLRKNSLILIIAVVLVLLLEALKKRQLTLLLFALLCALTSFSILPLVQKGYEHRADNTLKSGVPAMSYFAMGMQEASRGNGWYNGFNINTYQANNMDTQLTNQASKEAIAERMDYFRTHPSYTASFYAHKHLSQWADGTYASRQATLATFGGRRTFFNELYAGALSKYYIGYCNIYQNIVYGGVLFFCLLLLPLGKRIAKAQVPDSPTTLSTYIGLIGVLGGFLFHIIWEANSRYIFVYSLLLLPYAADGLKQLYQQLFHKH